MAKAETQLGVDFPFQLTISHPPLPLQRMFDLSKLLDFHEVRSPDGLEKVRHDLIVDVLAIKETETLIEVKPRHDMTYEAIAQEIEVVLGILAKRFKGNVKVTKLEWLVNRKGMASDTRSHQKRVI